MERLIHLFKLQNNILPLENIIHPFKQYQTIQVVVQLLRFLQRYPHPAQQGFHGTELLLYYHTQADLVRGSSLGIE